MNKPRREQLRKAIELLEQAESLIDEARELLDDAANDERESFDNMPLSIQTGERGQTMEQNADDLDEIASEIEEISITDLIDMITEIIER